MSSVNNSYSINPEVSSAACQVAAAVVSYADMRCFSCCQAGKFSQRQPAVGDPSGIFECKISLILFMSPIVSISYGI